MVVIIFALAAIFAPVLAPHDPLLVDVSIKLKNPSAAYPLGTDQLGRCILSRLLWGSRYSLSYSFTVLLITVCVGVPIGLFAGYVGGKIDSIIMRIIDVFMAMPVFIVALAIAGTVTKRDLSTIGTIGIMGLIGVILLSIVNIFVRSAALDLSLAVLALALFIGITAYDAQKIRMLSQQATERTVTAIAIIGALELYLDFINIFLHLLHLFGSDD